MIRTQKLIWLGLASVVLFLDQLSKTMALQHLNFNQQTPVMPLFNWYLDYNQGAAFSMLSDRPELAHLVFSSIALLVTVALVVWLVRLPVQQKSTAFSLALIIGGALGNLVDRLRLGYVVDFIQWYYEQWYWPTFNVADAAICVGAVLLALAVMREKA